MEKVNWELEVIQRDFEDSQAHLVAIQDHVKNLADGNKALGRNNTAGVLQGELQSDSDFECW